MQVISYQLDKLDDQPVGFRSAEELEKRRDRHKEQAWVEATDLMDGGDSADLDPGLGVFEAVGQVGQQLRDGVGAAEKHLVGQDAHLPADEGLRAAVQGKEFLVENLSEVLIAKSTEAGH